MRELAHRSKNQLAVVKGMASQTARQSASVEQFVEQFGQRIQGLAESQDLMVRQNWQGAWLSDLVSAHLDMFGAGPRAQIEGPALFLSANAVQNIGFALHELATNASKHGALTNPQGRVLVNWRGPEADGRIRLEWIEQDGPVVQSPQRHGIRVPRDYRTRSPGAARHGKTRLFTKWRSLASRHPWNPFTGSVNDN